MKAWLIPITLSLVTGTARADQCAWVDRLVANEANVLLERSPKYIEFCEPCGDKAPGIPQLAKEVEVTTPEGGYREISINGRPIDLAYVYVKTDATHYRNLGLLAGCDATGVSPSLTIEAETTNGVLISADTDALPPPPPPPPVTAVTTIPAMMTSPAPPPPSQIYVYTTTTHDVAWFAIALAAAGGLITGAALAFAFVAIGRRRSMVPRAMDIAGRLG
jgi:hypothetical protein